MWNALFWIILLFAAFNALVRSFQREDAGRQVYLYTLAGPRSVVLARTLHNALTMLVLSLLSLLFYVLFLGTDALGRRRWGSSCWWWRWVVWTRGGAHPDLGHRGAGWERTGAHGHPGLPRGAAHVAERDAREQGRWTDCRGA